jgi:RNA polymerase sigma factor (TIGR02999 family)
VLLGELRAGDPTALHRLFPLVYDELKRMARRQRRAWLDADTLDTTALVHEVYVRLVGGRERHWHDRAHFLAVAATAMRSILVDHARRRGTVKRGRGRGCVELHKVDSLLVIDAPAPEIDVEVLLALDAALQRLEAMSERQSRIVECRFFGGMSVPETGDALGISPASVKRGWAMARAWLYRELTEACTK